MRALSLVLAVALVAPACSSSQTSTSSREETWSSADVIVVDELSYPVGGLTAYDIVQREKSNWLERRGVSTFRGGREPIQVYLDGANQPYGDASSLRRINANQVDTIEHFSSREAQFRFGMGNMAGAILVKTRSGG